jgi:DNA-binding transcriptional regulator YhcF (GntR family)
MSNQDTNITNYITLNRKIFQHTFWEEKRPLSRFEAWLDLIQSARFEIMEAKKLIDGKMVTWQRGEIPASLRFLAARWEWSKNKVDHFLKMLEAENMIKRRTAEGTGQTVITLCNYDSYNVKKKIEGQQQAQQRDSEGTAEGQQRDKTNKENKEIRKERKKNAFVAPAVDDVIKYFEENGYNEEHARKAFKYYDDANWVDSQGSKVLNWKQKMQGVWFKQEGLKQVKMYGSTYNQNEDLERKRHEYNIQLQARLAKQAIA